MRSCRPGSCRRATTIEMLEPRTLLSVAFGPTASSSDPNLLALIGQAQTADIDGNGKADVVVGANTAGGNAALTRTDVLLGTGTGAFTVQAGPAFAAGSATSTNAFAVGDINGDGKPDLIYASQSNDGNLDGLITPELNTSTAGVASFSAAAATTIATPANFNPQQVVTADFNGDGHLDVAVLGLTGDAESLVVLNGDGDGAFTESYHTAVEVASGTPLTDGVLLSGDFNGDGKPDLAVYDPNSGEVTSFRSTGSSFTQTSTPVNLNETGTVPGAITTADLTGDGKTDLIVAENSSTGASDTVAVFLATGSGSNITFSAKTAVPAGNPAGQAIGGITAADFDGDGHVDVATDYGILLGAGTGALASPASALATSALAGTQGYTALLSGDLNGDGKPDLIGANQSNHTVVAGLNESTAPVTTVATTTTLATSNASITAGDVVTLTATVSAASGPAEGYVNFLSGTTLLGSAALSTTGVATLSTTALPSGTDSLTAAYLGSGVYVGSTSAAVTETVTETTTSGGGGNGGGTTGSGTVAPTLPNASTLIPSLAALKLPATEVAAQMVSLFVPVTLTNTATATYAGAATVTLYASDAAGFDGTQQLLQTTLIKRLLLRAGRTATVRVRVTSFPPALLGKVYLLATVTDSNGKATGVASATTTTVAAPFTAIVTTLATLKSASPVVGGTKTSAYTLVTLTDTGNINYIGRVSVALFGSTGKAVPAGAAALNTVVVARLGLKPNVPHRLRIPLKVNPPASRISTDYVLAQTTDDAGNVTTAPSATTITVAPPFVSLVAAVTSTAGTVKAAPHSSAALVLTLTNNGNVAATDTFTATVAASPTAGGATLPVQTATLRTSVAAGHARKLRIAIPTVSQLAAGSYLLTLQLTGSGASDRATATTAAPITVTA